MHPASSGDVNILSHIFFNVYLDRFDRWITQIQQEYTTQKATRKGAKLWKNATVMTSEEKRRFRFDQRNINRSVEIKTRKALMCGLSPKAYDICIARRGLNIGQCTMRNGGGSNYTRIRYVRHGDALLLGVTGPKAIVEHLRNRISTFLKSDLKLHIEQCTIVHAVGNRVKFIGV